jgi:hypothetical protein
LAAVAAVAVGTGVACAVPISPGARTDPRRVERVLANLAANALRHGAPPVEVEVDGPVVRVRDHGTVSRPICSPSFTPPAPSASARAPEPAAPAGRGPGTSVGAILPR